MTTLQFVPTLRKLERDHLCDLHVVVDALGPGEDLEASHTQKVFTMGIRIALKMLFQELLNLFPVGESARISRSAKWRKLLTECTADIENVRVIDHRWIISNA